MSAGVEAVFHRAADTVDVRLGQLLISLLPELVGTVRGISECQREAT